MTTTRKILLFCLLGAALIGIDRFTKMLAKEHLKGKEPITYLHDTVRIGYVENTGAFLSFGADWPGAVSFWVLGILPLLLLLAFLIYCIVKAKTLAFNQLVPFALIFAGGTGNIIDRLMYNRHVSDFMNVGIGSLRTGIFNFADLCVSTAVVILVVHGFRKDKLKAGHEQIH